MAAKTKKKLFTRVKESKVGKASRWTGDKLYSGASHVPLFGRLTARGKMRRKYKLKDEEDRIEAIRKKKQDEEAGAAKDASKGGEIDKFNSYVMDAATKATEWNPENILDISDAMKTITHPEMMYAIEEGERIVADSTGKTLSKSMRSPLEEKEEGGKYGPAMEARREELVKMLAATSLKQDSMTDKLEIIYCAMVGQAGVWDNWKQFDDVHELGPEEFTLSKLKQLVSRDVLDPIKDPELRKYGISEITRDELIEAIQNADVEFPQEKIDPDYKEVLGNTRKKIAQAIETGSLSQLSSSDLEIVYATLKNEAKHFSPSPKEVFFDMLIKAAMAARAKDNLSEEAEYWHGTGSFMGSVLKHLVRSITLNKEVPDNIAHAYGIQDDGIMDAAVADEFIRHGLEGSEIDMFKVQDFLEAFRETAKEVLMTPTDEVVTEHNVPGLGYDELDQARITTKEASEDLKQALHGVTDEQTLLDVANLLKTYKTGVLTKDELKLIQELKAWIPDALQTKDPNAPAEFKDDVERKVKSLMDELLPQVARDLNTSVQNTHALCTNGNGPQALEALVAYENEHLVERGEVAEDVSRLITELKKELESRKQILQPAMADNSLIERQRKSRIEASADRVKGILDDLDSKSLDGALGEALKNLLNQVGPLYKKERPGTQDNALEIVKSFEEKHRAGRKKLDPAKVSVFDELKQEVTRRNDVLDQVAAKEAEIASLRNSTTDSGKTADELIDALALDTIWPGKSGADFAAKLKSTYTKSGKETKLLVALDRVEAEAKKGKLSADVFDSLNELRIKIKEKTVTELKASMPNNLTKIEVLATSLMLSPVDKEKDKLLQDLKAMTDEGKADKAPKAQEVLEDFEIRMNHPLKKVAKELLKKLSKDEDFLRAGYPPPSEFIIAKNTYRPPIDEVNPPADRTRGSNTIRLRNVLGKPWLYYPKMTLEYLLGKGKKIKEQLSNFWKKPFVPIPPFSKGYLHLKYKRYIKRAKKNAIALGDLLKEEEDYKSDVITKITAAGANKKEVRKLKLEAQKELKEFREKKKELVFFYGKHTDKEKEEMLDLEVKKFISGDKISELNSERVEMILDNADKRYKFRAGLLKLSLYAYIGLWGGVSVSDWIVPDNRFYKSGMFRPIDGEVFTFSRRNILARMWTADNWNVFNPFHGDFIEWPWKKESIVRNFFLAPWEGEYDFSREQDERPKPKLFFPHDLRKVENNANGPTVIGSIKDPKHYAENKDDLNKYPRSINHQLSVLTGVGYILPEEAKPRGEETKEEAYERAREMAEARLTWLKEKNLEQSPWMNRGRYLQPGIKIPSVLTYLDEARAASRVSVAPHKKYPVKRRVVKTRSAKDRYILKMDPGLADRLVNELMKIDPAGTKITLSFLRKNSHIWYARGYLERSVDARFYRSCGIRNPEHVDFLVANPELQKYMLRLSTLGGAPYHLVGADKGTADEMLSHMMGEYRKVLRKPNLGRVHIEDGETLAKLLMHYDVKTHLVTAKAAHEAKPDKLRDKFFIQVEAYLAQDSRDLEKLKEFLDEAPKSERTRLLVGVLYDNEELKKLAVTSGWIENREGLYKARKIAAERSRLKEKYRLSTDAEYVDAAKKKMSVAEYLRQNPVLERFISHMWKGKGFVVRRDRAEQFIRDIMKRHLKEGANLKRIVIDLNPKTKGDEAKWAITMGYITDHKTAQREREKKQTAAQRAERREALEKEIIRDKGTIKRLENEKKSVFQEIEGFKLKIKDLEGWTPFTGNDKVAELKGKYKYEIEVKEDRLRKIEAELIKLRGAEGERIPKMESSARSAQFWAAKAGAVDVVQNLIGSFFKEEVQVGTKEKIQKFRGRQKRVKVPVMKTREAIFYENHPLFNTREKALVFVLEELSKDIEKFEMDLRQAGGKSVQELSMAKTGAKVMQVVNARVKKILQKPKEKPPKAKPSPEKKEEK